MLSSLAIDAVGVSKKYRRQSGQSSYNTLRDTIVNGFRRAINGKPSNAHANAEEDHFWALQDIDFRVSTGEVVGLIGKNGAGKSTLLKILSRITEPTSGFINIHGRVGSLLEVGTGFHPELTGRENVYLNGAILGLRRDEIRAKFDAIVDFSGVSSFIDTPVKHYSSGMQARLGFAVAAHLEPEVLIVDEVLAVGDAAFQKQCLGKMRDVAGEGRTVLYVSHNLASLNTLCTRGIVLSKGTIDFDGGIDDAVTHYLRDMFPEDRQFAEYQQRGIDGFKIAQVRISDQLGNDSTVIRHGDDCTLRFCFENNTSKPLDGAVAGVLITNDVGQDVINVNSVMTGDEFSPLPASGEIVLSLTRLALLPGYYHILFNISAKDEFVCQIYSGLNVQVVDGDFYGSGRGCTTKRATYMPECKWTLEA